DSGTLGGATSQVSLSVMSFSLKALAVVETAVAAARLCPLFSTKNREALQIGKPSWHGPDQLLGPSVGWVSRYESVVKSWLAAGRTLRIWTVETEQQLRRIQRLGIQQVTVNDPAWALQYLKEQTPNLHYIHRVYRRIRSMIPSLCRRNSSEMVTYNRRSCVSTESRGLLPHSPDRQPHAGQPLLLWLLPQPARLFFHNQKCPWRLPGTFFFTPADPASLGSGSLDSQSVGVSSVSNGLSSGVSTS